MEMWCVQFWNLGSHRWAFHTGGRSLTIDACTFTSLKNQLLLNAREPGAKFTVGIKAENWQNNEIVFGNLMKIVVCSIWAATAGRFTRAGGRCF